MTETVALSAALSRLRQGDHDPDIQWHYTAAHDDLLELSGDDLAALLRDVEVVAAEMSCRRVEVFGLTREGDEFWIRFRVA